jgi:hypothetical protein
MIKIFAKKTAIMASAMVFVAMMSSGSRATSLTLTPDAATIGSGDPVNVVVKLEGLDPSADVSAFDFNVNFNSDVLAFDSYALTNQLGVIDNNNVFNFSELISPGCLNLSELSYLTDLPAQDEPLTLATLTFTGKYSGISDLSFALLEDMPAAGNSILDYWGNPISVTTLAASITNVSEPSTILLSLSGLVSLLGLGLFRKKVN